MARLAPWTPREYHDRFKPTSDEQCKKRNVVQQSEQCARWERIERKVFYPRGSFSKGGIERSC